ARPPAARAAPRPTSWPRWAAPRPRWSLAIGRRPSLSERDRRRQLLELRAPETSDASQVVERRERPITLARFDDARGEDRADAGQRAQLVFARPIDVDRLRGR